MVPLHSASDLRVTIGGSCEMKQPRRDVSQDISASNNISNTANAAGCWRFPACRRHRITTTAARSTPVRYGRRRALTDLEGRPGNTLIATLSGSLCSSKGGYRSEEHTSELQSLMS